MSTWRNLHWAIRTLIIGGGGIFALCVLWVRLQNHARLEDDRSFVDLYLKVVGGILVSFSIGFAALTYVRNGKLERTKWLAQLHEKFFEKDFYSDIRILLDYKKPESDYEKLKVLFPGNEDGEYKLQEKLVGYLNFFEFLATLVMNNQLRKEEVRMVFGYYILNLKQHDWLISSLEKNKFRNLPTLINEIERLDQ